jgi:hypothetical protein
MGCIPYIFFIKTGTNVLQKNGVSKPITTNGHIQRMLGCKTGALQYCYIIQPVAGFFKRYMKHPVKHILNR